MLYAIIDSDLCAARGLEPLAVAEACLRGGATLLQLRDKSSASSRFLARADAIVARCRAHGARLVVNDRADIAVLAGADGVHVGQDDLSVEDARRIVGDRAIVGVSTHSPEQVDAAVATRASYIAVGPIFSTASKDTGYEARGLALVEYAARQGRPVVAIGGITLERAPAVVAAGATAVAVISDLLGPDGVESRARAYAAALPALPFKV